MDWTSILAGSPFSGLLPQPGQSTSSAPGAPTNILPAVAQSSPTPTPAAAPAQQPGLLNQPQGQNGNDAAIAQALKMVQQPTPQVQSAAPQIQMARPAGSAAGFNPATILAAMRGQPVTQ
jgi:hypothetical protein